MNKLLMALLFLTFVGAGVLFWLMKSYPVENVPIGEHKTEEHKTEEAKAGDHGGEHKTDDAHAEQHKTEESKHAEHQTESATEHAKADEHKSEESKSAEAHSEVKAHDATEAKKDESHKTDHAAHSKTAESKTEHSSDTKNTQLLFINTTPVSAMVFVEGEMKGQTPLQVELGSSPQQIKLEAAGYEDVVREVPARTHSSKSPNVEQYTWKITMKQKASKPEKKSQPVADYVIHGKKGPHWVQIKSFSVAEVAASKQFVTDTRAKMGSNVFACDVALGDKGTWTRVLVGPFNDKKLAQKESAKLAKTLNEQPFVTGTQTCL
jgi:hypothetical protein